MSRKNEFSIAHHYHFLNEAPATGNPSPKAKLMRGDPGLATAPAGIFARMCGRVAAEISSRSNLSALLINFGFALPLIFNAGIVFFAGSV